MPNLPVRERILAEVAKRLGYIAEGASYFNTVSQVTRTRLAPPASVDGPVSLQVWSPGEVLTDQRVGLGDSTGIFEVTMTVVVRVWRYEMDISDTTANLLVHDVKKAILVGGRSLTDDDGTVSYNRRWTQTQAVSDETTSPYAALDVLFEFDFRESFADPSQVR